MYNDEEMKQPATKADLHKVETSVQTLGTRVRTLETSVQTLETSVQKLDAKIDRVAKEVVRGHARADAAERRITDQIKNFRSDILKVVENFMGQVGKVDRRQIIVDHRIDRLEKRVDMIEARPRA